MMRQDTIRSDSLFTKNRWDPKAQFNLTSEEGGRSEWDCIRLRELVRVRKGSKKPPSNPHESFVYVGLENVEPKTGDLVGDVHKVGGEVKSLSKLFQRDDILISRLRPNLNKVMVPEFEYGYCSGEFIVLETITESLNPRVIRELLSDGRIVKLLMDLVAGATLPRFSASDLLNIYIPTIPVEMVPELNDNLLAFDSRRRMLKQELANQPSAITKCIECYFRKSAC